MNKGVLITFYGVNNIGKTTLARKVMDHLKAEGYDVLYLKYPLYDLEPTGPELNRILRGGEGQNISEEELQKLFMKNRLDFEPKLKKMLAEGKIVLAEDYSGTGIAWGTAKGLDFSWIKDLNKNLVQEDFALLLKGKRYLKSREKGHIHEENDLLIKKVEQVFEDLAKERGWSVLHTKENIEETVENILKVLRDFLKSRKVG